MTSPVRAVRRLYRAAWVWYRGEAVSADVNADDADPPTPGGDGDGDGDAAAVERSYARLISAAKIPPAAQSTVNKTTKLTARCGVQRCPVRSNDASW